MITLKFLPVNDAWVWFFGDSLMPILGQTFFEFKSQAIDAMANLYHPRKEPNLVRRGRWEFELIIDGENK